MPIARPRGSSFCGGNEQEPVPTTNIKHGFIAAKFQACEEAIAGVKFTREATAWSEHVETRASES